MALSTPSKIRGIQRGRATVVGPKRAKTPRGRTRVSSVFAQRPPAAAGGYLPVGKATGTPKKINSALANKRRPNPSSIKGPVITGQDMVNMKKRYPNALTTRGGK